MSYNLKIIEHFISEQNYYSNPNLLGIIIYGSFATDTYTNLSDIDVMILFDETFVSKYKGYKKYNNTKIEYFEQNIKHVKERMYNDFSKGGTTIYSIFNKCIILYQKQNKVTDLIDFILSFYNSPLPKLSEQDIIYTIVSINNRMERLKEMVNTLPFYSYYFSTLNKAVDFYHLYKGYPLLGDSKKYKVYDNGQMDNYLSIKTPCAEFKNLYKKALMVTNSNDNYKTLKNIFNFILNSIELEIDFDNIKINIINKYY